MIPLESFGCRAGPHPGFQQNDLRTAPSMKHAGRVRTAAGIEEKCTGMANFIKAKKWYGTEIPNLRTIHP